MPNSAVTPTTELDALLTTRHEGHGLPRAFYHDAPLYDAEIRTIWQGGWLFAGFEIEIPQPGDFLTLAVDGSSVLVIRDDAGSVRAFHNVCRHRGSQLCRNESGTCAPLCARITAGRIPGRGRSSHAPACTMASTRRSSVSSPFTSA